MIVAHDGGKDKEILDNDEKRMGSHNNMDRSLQRSYIVSRKQSIKWRRKEKHDSINQT
jgi:hypothetical protein